MTNWWKINIQILKSFIASMCSKEQARPCECPLVNTLLLTGYKVRWHQKPSWIIWMPRMLWVLMRMWIEARRYQYMYVIIIIERITKWVYCEAILKSIKAILMRFFHTRRGRTFRLSTPMSFFFSFSFFFHSKLKKSFRSSNTIQIKL